MKAALLFPGQGSQYVGMGKDFYDAFREAKDVFDEADDLLSMPLTRILFEGPQDLLTQTRYSQIAIFVMSAALFQTLQKATGPIHPSVCAGLSLGEYTALFAAGRIDFADALRLVKNRGDLMNGACETFSGTMAAVLGLSSQKVEEVLSSMPEPRSVWPANFNCPGQTVISGTHEGVAEATNLLKEQGAKRVLPLQVHGAFHSGLMQSAQDGLEKAIVKTPFRESNTAVAMNACGDYVQESDAIRSYLVKQLTQPVRWEETIDAMKRNGVEFYLEIGCGKTLSGMNKKMGIVSESICSLEKVSEFDEVVRKWQDASGGSL